MDISQLGDGQENTNQIHRTVSPSGNRPKVTMLPGETRKEYQKRFQRIFRAWNRETYNAYMLNRKRSNPARTREISKRSYHKNKSRPDLVEKKRAYRKKNQPEHYQKQKAWKAENKERVKALNDKWHSENKDYHRKQQRAYQNHRLATDPVYKLTHLLRCRMRCALQVTSAKKVSSTIELLGCSPAQFKAHLESQFDANMSWSNYGSYWSVDHIKPLAGFDLTDGEQQKIAFHYTNCQPLEKIENIRKGDK
jgi:hypothetical protein